MKKVILIVVILNLIATPALGADKVNLRWFNWDAAEEELNKLYEKGHPDVEVELATAPFNDFWIKFNALATAGDLPEVFIPDWVEWRGTLEQELNRVFNGGAGLNKALANINAKADEILAILQRR